MNKRKRTNMKSPDCLKRNGGYSLVEALVTVLIFSVIIGAIHATLQVGDSSWNVNSVNIALQQELRKAMDWMKDDLRQSGPTAITMDFPADGVWYDTITFQISNGVSGGGIVWSTDTIQFLRDAGGLNQLQRVEGSTTRVLATNITSLQFRRLTASPNIVDVALQAQKVTSKTGGTVTSSLNFKVKLRN